MLFRASKTVEGRLKSLEKLIKSMAKEPMDANTTLLEEQLSGIRAAAQGSPDVGGDLTPTSVSNPVSNIPQKQPVEDPSSSSWQIGRDAGGMYNQPSGVSLTLPAELQDHNMTSLYSNKDGQMHHAQEIGLEEIARWFGHPGDYTTRSPSAEGFPVWGEEAYTPVAPRHQQAQVSPRDDAPSGSSRGRLDMLYQ